MFSFVNMQDSLSTNVECVPFTFLFLLHKWYTMFTKWLLKCKLS